MSNAINGSTKKATAMNAVATAAAGMLAVRAGLRRTFTVDFVEEVMVFAAHTLGRAKAVFF